MMVQAGEDLSFHMGNAWKQERLRVINNKKFISTLQSVAMNERKSHEMESKMTVTDRACSFEGSLLNGGSFHVQDGKMVSIVE